jgi:hypothetical protein
MEKGYLVLYQPKHQFEPVTMQYPICFCQLWL